MKRYLLKSLWILSIMACAGCNLKEAADCVQEQTQCTSSNKNKMAVYEVCNADGTFEFNMSCVLGCDNNKCRSLNRCDSDTKDCRQIDNDFALVLECKDSHMNITPCTGVCEGNECNDAGAQGSCVGTEQPFCAQTVAIWCDSNQWKTTNCEEMGKICVNGQCVSESNQPDDHTGDDTGGDDTGNDDNGSKIEGSVFHIQTGKGILDYQNLSDEERKNLTKLVIHGSINLNDAKKTVMSDDNTSCSWDGWESLKVPDGMEVTGEDDAKIYYKKDELRCVLNKAMFKEMNHSGIHDIAFDFDYNDEADGGILIDKLVDSKMSHVEFHGSAVFKEKHWSYGLIGWAENATIEHVSVEYEILNSSIDYRDYSVGYQGGLVGHGECVDKACLIDDVSIVIKEGLVEDRGFAPHFGGVIGWLSGSCSITNSRVSMIDFYNHSNFTGGLIAQSQKLPVLNVNNVYVHLGIDTVLSDSGGIMGSWYQDKDIVETHNIKNVVIRIVNPNNKPVAGIYGLNGNTGSTINSSVKIENAVVIADNIYGGLAGSSIQMPDLKNVVIASPQTSCDAMIFGKNENEIGLCSASTENVYYYHENAACDSLGSCFNVYGTQAEANSIVSTLNKDSTAIEWRVNSVKVGDKTIPVPVFPANGVYPE